MVEVDKLKENAGIAACSFVEDGMAIGLGTGSTVRYSIIEVARLVKHEGIGVIGMLINFLFAITISSITKPPPIEVYEIVDNIRLPGGNN